jgi:hypothetical protein
MFHRTRNPRQGGYINMDSDFVMSESELDNICSALKAIKIEGTPHIPIHLECDTIILNESLSTVFPIIKGIMIQFERDHRNSLDDFAKNENCWTFRYHYCSVNVSVYRVKKHLLSEFDHNDYVQGTTHVSISIQYNLKHMYANSPLDHVVLQEMLDLYGEMRQELKG